MSTFYHRLNQSHTNLDNKEYIQKTKSLMQKYMGNQSKQNHLLIIGAGNLSDFDLEYFLEKFDSVLLTDIDTLSVEKALGNERLRQPNIRVLNVDYIGVRDTAFFDDFEKILKYKSYEDVQSMTIEKLNQLKQFSLTKKIDQTFDAIYISPIYTQLFYREAEAKLNALVEKGLSQVFKDKLLSHFLQSMTEIIDRFNKDIPNLLNDDGIIFVASDIFYLDNNAFSSTVRKAIHNDERMNDLHHEYQSRYGYGMGDYGLESLSEKLNPLESTWALWGKTQYHDYAVKFQVMKKMRK